MTQIDWDELADARRVEGLKALILVNIEGREYTAPFNGGWLNYADSQHTEGSPQAVTANTPTLMTINGLASGTEQRYRRGIDTSVWSGNTLRPTSIGESYLVRVTMRASKATSNDTTIELDLGIGSGFSTIIADERKPLTKGQGVTDNLSFTFPVFCLETFCTNGVQFTIIATRDVNVWGKSIFIQRLFTP
jgi:hypothetical protein